MTLDWQINERADPALIRAWLPPAQAYTDASSTEPLWLQLENKAKGGWHPLSADRGVILGADDYLMMPGLAPLAPVAYAVHLGERIFVYPAAFICLVQLGGAYSIGRIS